MGEKIRYHAELLKALKAKNYKKICEHLHTNHYESDSDWTIKRCDDSYIQAWRDCEKYYEQYHGFNSHRYSQKCEG